MTSLAVDMAGGERKSLRLSAAHGGPPRLLLAEDSDPIRIVTAAMLKGMGCEVDSVIHGEYAVQMAGKKPFDVIVLDIEMPVMDGITAARSIRRLDCARATPLMALSAFLADSMRGGYWRDTFDIALPKPANRNELHDAVKAALAWQPEPPESAAEGVLPVLEPDQLSVLKGGITPDIWRQLADCACRDIEVSANQLEHAASGGSGASISVYATKLANLGRTFAAPRLEVAAYAVLRATADEVKQQKIAVLLAAARATVAALRG